MKSMKTSCQPQRYHNNVKRPEGEDKEDLRKIQRTSSHRPDNICDDFYIGESDSISGGL